MGSRILDSHLVGGGAAAGRVRLGVAGGVPLDLPLQNLHADIRGVQETSLAEIRLGGVISRSDLDSVVIPGLAAMARLSAPAITDAEVAAAVYRSFPLDIDLAHDGGGNDALSIGIGFEAVGAWFTPEL
jgi:hypothetical protein